MARFAALKDVAISPIIILAMFEFASFFIRINSEIVARKNFHQLHSSKEALFKFKDLVQKLPTSLLIFSRDMKKE